MTKVYTLLKRGTAHENHCEDYLLHLQEENYFFSAVLDGCSGGKESYFASALLGKLLRKIFPEIEIDISLEFALKNVTQQLLREFYELSQLIKLPLEEQLSTVIIAIMDTKNKQTEVLAIGDGIIVADNELINIDQQNKPDYLAYHLPELLDTKIFEIWWTNSAQRYSFSETKNFVISTDGLLSFYRADAKNYESKPNEDAYELLLKSDKLKNSQAKLARSINILKNKKNLLHYDDIAMIRICEQD